MKKSSFVFLWLGTNVLFTCIFLVIYLVTFIIVQTTPSRELLKTAQDNAWSFAIQREAGNAGLVFPKYKTVDITKDSDQFIILYDKQKQVVLKSTLQDETQLALPADALDKSKEYAPNNLTWQPQKGVYINASIVWAGEYGWSLAGKASHGENKALNTLNATAAATAVLLLAITNGIFLALYLKKYKSRS